MAQPEFRTAIGFDDLLAELGYTPAAIERLLAAGVVADLADPAEGPKAGEERLAS